MEVQVLDDGEQADLIELTCCTYNTAPTALTAIWDQLATDDREDGAR